MSNNQQVEGVLTREEVGAWIAANEKMATQLGVIAGQLANIAVSQQKIIEMQDKLLTRMSDEMPKQVINGIAPEIKAVVPEIKTTHDRLAAIEKQQQWMSWVLTGLGVLVGAITVIKMCCGRV